MTTDSTFSVTKYHFTVVVWLSAASLISPDVLNHLCINSPLKFTTVVIRSGPRRRIQPLFEPFKGFPCKPVYFDYIHLYVLVKTPRCCLTLSV